MEALFPYKDKRTLQWALSFTGGIRGQIFFAFVGDQLLYTTAALILACPCSASQSRNGYGLSRPYRGHCVCVSIRPRVKTFVSTESESSLIWQVWFAGASLKYILNLFWENIIAN